MTSAARRTVGALIGFAAPWLLITFVASVAVLRVVTLPQWLPEARAVVCIISLVCAFIGATIAEETAW